MDRPKPILFIIGPYSMFVPALSPFSHNVSGTPDRVTWILLTNKVVHFISDKEKNLTLVTILRNQLSPQGSESTRNIPESESTRRGKNIHKTRKATSTSHKNQIFLLNLQVGLKSQWVWQLYCSYWSTPQMAATCPTKSISSQQSIWK